MPIDKDAPAGTVAPLSAEDRALLAETTTNAETRDEVEARPLPAPPGAEAPPIGEVDFAIAPPVSDAEASEEEIAVTTAILSALQHIAQQSDLALKRANLTWAAQTILLERFGVTKAELAAALVINRPDPAAATRPVPRTPSAEKE